MNVYLIYIICVKFIKLNNYYRFKTNVYKMSHRYITWYIRTVIMIIGSLVYIIIYYRCKLIYFFLKHKKSVFK